MDPNLDLLIQEGQRVLMGKIPCQTPYMQVYIRSNGETFPELQPKFQTLWEECVHEAARNLGYE